MANAEEECNKIQMVKRSKAARMQHKSSFLACLTFQIVSQSVWDALFIYETDETRNYSYIHIFSMLLCRLSN